MSKTKRCLTQWLSEWQGHLLSCLWTPPIECQRMKIRISWAGQHHHKCGRGYGVGGRDRDRTVRAAENYTLSDLLWGKSSLKLNFRRGLLGPESLSVFSNILHLVRLFRRVRKNNWRASHPDSRFMGCIGGHLGIRSWHSGNSPFKKENIARVANAVQCHS